MELTDELFQQWKDLKTKPQKLGADPSRTELELYILRQLRNEACQHIPNEAESVSAMIINRELAMRQLRGSPPGFGRRF